MYMGGTDVLVVECAWCVCVCPGERNLRGGALRSHAPWLASSLPAAAEAEAAAASRLLPVEGLVVLCLNADYQWVRNGKQY